MNNLPILYTIPIWNLSRGYGDKKEIFIPESNLWVNFRWVKRKIKNFDENRYYQRWVLNKTVESEYIYYKCVVCKKILRTSIFGDHKMTCGKKCSNFMINNFPEYENSRKLAIKNNPVLQEGGLTTYLKNHPERGLNNRLKAYKDRRTGFGYMHDNKDSEMKWIRNMLNKGKVYTSSSASKISLELFNKLDKLLRTMGFGKSYYGDNEYKVYTRNSGDSKYYRLLDFYNKFLNIAIEFQGDYWHPRDILKYGCDKVFSSIVNDTDRANYIKNSIGCRFYFITESDYVNNKESVINEILEDIELYNQCV